METALMKFHYYLLINPTAGGGNGKKVGKQITTLLEQKQQLFTILETKYHLHEIKLINKLIPTILTPWSVQAKQSQAPFPLLIVIGGDGTLHQVVNSIPNQIPIAYIPAGSGNDFARSLKLLQTPAKMLENILQTTKPRKVNLLSARQQNDNIHSFCVNNIGIGLDAAIVHATNHSTAKQQLYKYNISSLTYIRSALRALFKQKGFPITIKCNNQSYYFKQAFLCTITNHPYFGGGINIAPMANIHEAQMDLMIVERLPMFKIFYLIVLLLLQKHTRSKYFHHFKAKNIQLSSPTRQFLQKDGEDSDKAAYDFTFSTTEQFFWF